jgi:hypothetical protein
MHAVGFHFSDSRLSGGDITAATSELSLLPDVFSLCHRSVHAVWRHQGNAIDGKSYSSLSPLSAGRLRPGSMNG